MRLRLIHDDVVILESEIIEYQAVSDTVLHMVIPLEKNGEYSEFRKFSEVDLIRIKAETSVKYYDGYGRIYQAYFIDYGIVLKIKFDTDLDIH